MSIEGRIAVDVSFADSATSGGVQSLKKITLTDTTPYTAGKVAIVTGTCGTASSAVAVAPTTYKDANGNVVSFVTIERFAFSATGAKCRCQNDWASVQSSGGNASVCELKQAADDFQVNVDGTAGTASYTLVIYGT
jgi:hypothetical protein